MAPRATTPKSNFYGPWHRTYQTPLPGSVIVQFHNLEPGEFWNPTDGIIAQQPFLLPPFGTDPRWRIVTPVFSVLYNQRFDRLRIVANHRPTNALVFNLDLKFGVFTAGYNTLQDPAGNFSWGGTLTMQWKGLPSP